MIVVVSKGRLDWQPPALTVLYGLRSLGKDVLCICSGCNSETRSGLEAAGVEVIEVCPQNSQPAKILAKIAHYVNFRRTAWEVIDARAPNSTLWIATLDSAMALGRRLIDKRFILALLELYDRAPFYYRKAIVKYAPKAHLVVVPEACRAAVLRAWYDLKRTPTVLPNRPLSHPRKRNLPITSDAARSAIDSIKGQRAVLYQGFFSGDRDLVSVAQAVYQIGEPYRLVLMGHNDERAMTALRGVCPNLVYIPWLPPPVHLEVTSHAFIGVAGYRYDSLNSVFCAPNKIWEYAGFGIPMICQDLPGLRYTVGVAKAGICTGFEKAEAIVNAIRTVADDYEGFGQRASVFYDSCETSALLKEILHDE